MRKVFLVIVLLFSISNLCANDNIYVYGIGNSNLKNLSNRKNQAYLSAINDLLLKIQIEIDFNKFGIKLDSSSINKYIDFRESWEDKEESIYYFKLGISKDNYNLFLSNFYNDLMNNFLDKKLKIYNEFLELDEAKKEIERIQKEKLVIFNNYENQIQMIDNKLKGLI